MINGRNRNEINLIKMYFDFKQEHLFYFWPELTEIEKDQLINDLSNIDLKDISRTFQDYKSFNTIEQDYFAADYFSLESIKEQQQKLKAAGENALRTNQVAFLTVAGGQGSRLNYEHPKGCFTISPIKKKSLFQLFAEKINFYNQYYQNKFYWFIMTSSINHDEIMDFFKMHHYFGLDSGRIFFFRQGMFPSLTFEGKLILSQKYRLFQNPDGHGGILKALLNNGLLHEMQKIGIRYLSYFQIDNPLVRIADPCFIGYHILEKSQVSSKVVSKLYPEEKLGVITKTGRVNRIVEYSDLSKGKMYETSTNGLLKYRMGSIAIHLFNTDFLANFTPRMPIHYAQKMINAYDFSHKIPVLSDFIGIKFESFVFDTIAYSDKSVFYETDRKEEFSPLKNMTGNDSIETCEKGQINVYREWLKAADMITNDFPLIKIEINPLYAPDREIFLQKARTDTDNIKKMINESRQDLKDIYLE